MDDLSEDFEQFQLDSPQQTALKTQEELEQHTVDEHLSDVERAVYLLSSGEEVQRISVINSLPHLLEGNKDECMRRIVPKVREVLHVSGSEVQVAAARAFVEILRKNLVTPQVYASTFLKSVLQLIEVRDPNALQMSTLSYSSLETLSAWLDALLDIIDLLPRDILKKDALSAASSKGQLQQPPLSRIACCRMLGRLAPKFDPQIIKKEILPLVQSLCQDVEYDVRGCMCKNLDSVARGLGLEATKASILPELIELAGDEESCVRICGLETIVNILSLLDEDTLTGTILPLVQKFCNTALANNDATLAAVSRLFGELCTSLQKVMTEETKRWAVDFFKKICRVGATKGKNGEDDAEESGAKSTFSQVWLTLNSAFEEEDKTVDCRKYSAYNFPRCNTVGGWAGYCMPAMILFVGPKSFKSELHASFTTLIHDPHVSVRKTISAAFSECCKQLGNVTICLLPDLLQLLKDENTEVLHSIVPNTGAVLELMARSSGAHAETKIPNSGELVHVLLAAEAVAFASHDWRLQCAIIQSWQTLPSCLAPEAIHNKFITLLLKKIKLARAVPVRRAVMRTLMVLLRCVRRQEQREEVYDTLISNLCLSRSWVHRALFIDLCHITVEVYSKAFFKEHFFDPALSLVDDPIPNIKIRLCALIPTLKTLITLPGDRALLQQLEKCVRKLMIDERNDSDVNYAVKRAVEGMDKINAPMESLSRKSSSASLDMADQKKEDEERKLIELEERERREEESRKGDGKKGRGLAGKTGVPKKNIPRATNTNSSNSPQKRTTGGASGGKSLSKTPSASGKRVADPADNRISSASSVASVSSSSSHSSGAGSKRGSLDSSRRTSFALGAADRRGSQGSLRAKRT